MVGCASVSVWAQAGQCAGTAARPGQWLLVAVSMRAVVTAMQAAVPKAVHAWREEVLHTAIWCVSSCLHMQHALYGCSVHAPPSSTGLSQLMHLCQRWQY